MLAPTRLVPLLLAIALTGCGHVPLAATATYGATAHVLSDADLDAMDKKFQAMRPSTKASYLNAMNSALKKRWDAYQAAHEKAYSDANPPVTPLAPADEASLRSAIKARFPALVTKTNLKAAVDCDGIGPAYGDKYTDFQTSVAIGGQSLDADLVLYHVTPVGHAELNGALAINFYHGRMVPSVYGDAGPAWGEACHLVIQELGLPSSPIDGGDTKGHDMLLIPGLGAAFKAKGLQPTPANLLPFCRAQGVPGFDGVEVQADPMTSINDALSGV